jgi:hypothetical protein
VTDETINMEPTRPAFCGQCGFDLEGSVGDVCSECGADIWLAQLKLETWPTGWLMATVIASIVVAAATIFLPSCGEQLSNVSHVIAVLGGLLLGVGHALVLVWAAFRTPEENRTRRLTIAAWLGPLVGLADFLIVYFGVAWLLCG